MLKRAVGGSVLVLIVAAALWAGALSEAIATDVKLTGTFSTAVALPQPGLAIRGLAAFHDDGTCRFTNIVQFGGFETGFGKFVTNSQYCEWVKTAARSIEGVGYSFLADPETGVVHSVAKYSFVADYDKNGETGSGQAFIGVFECPLGDLTCPEPADLPPVFEPFGDFTFRRLSVH